MNIYCCLLALVLGCNASAGAGIIHKTIKEKDPVTLPCPHSVEGKVMWSRERNGRRVDILLIDGDRDIRLLHKPYKGYSSLADKSLHIVRAGVSDSGRYFCDNKVAAELTVIPSGAGIIHKTIKEKDPVTLPCPHSVEGIKTTLRTTLTPTTPTTPTRKTAATTSTPTEHRPAATTALFAPSANTDTAKKKDPNKKHRKKKHKDQKQLLFWGIGIVVSFLLLLQLIIIFYFTWRHRFKNRESERMQPVYDDIQGGVVFQPARDESDPNDPTYCTIPDLPPGGRRYETLRPNESPYSLIGSTFLRGNNEGSMQLSDNTYFLLEKPKEPENNNDQSIV
ncbi:uncharacterized protein LOC123976700 [Micropterus dolomieu]|uniref:uncharacterized protein LOC123976700 n=1 Tax=Micropterus dolomieu TaxID=147949 RepID=UPI001E8CC0FE|nr:uncharacterized protein LOC123976700 [Micropterus dolomieu]